MSAPSAMWTVYSVFRKEVLDALRDTRTLLVVLASGALVGPLAVLFMLSGVEDTSPLSLEVQVSGIEFAPSLQMYLAHQNATLMRAPADYEAQMRAATFAGPVLVLPANFEPALAHGDRPEVVVLSGSTDQRTQTDADKILQILEGFVHERVTANLAAHGLEPRLLEPVRVTSRNLAQPPTTAAVFARMLPYLMIFAVLYGALGAALDTTSGERERGSLEPLLTNPSQHGALALGKWAAVAGVSMLVALLCCLSLLLTQWLMHNERLQHMLHFGLREAWLSLLLLWPLAAALPAALMAVAVRCKTHKEAQANSNMVILLLSALPVASIFNNGESAWQLWVPGLAQNVLIGRVFNGETVSVAQLAAPLATSAALTAVAIGFVAHKLRQAATK